MMKLLEKYGPVWAPEGAGGGSSAAPQSSGGGGSGASSGASAPSSAPSSPSPGGPASRSVEPSAPSGSPAGAGEAPPAFDYGAMFGDGPPVDLPLETSAPAPAAPAQEPTPVAPPAPAAPVAAPATGEAPAAAPPAQGGAPVGGPPQAGEAPALDPYNPGMLAEHLARSEAQAIEFVAQNMFQLTPQEIEAVEQDVIGAIPKLLSKVFVKSQQNWLQQLDKMIPVMVQRHTDAMKRNGEGEEKFYGAWPNIGREHSDLVNRYAMVYRQMHPKATLDELIRDVGPMVMMAARIPPNLGPTGQQAAGRAAPAANGRPPQPAPFTPAGGGPVSASKTQELSPWEAMFVGRE
jgi:hypothetical protein